MANLPQTVRVGPFDYSLHKIDSAYVEESGHIGEHRGNSLEIGIYSDMHDQRIVEVLWHEIFHAMWLSAGLTEHHTKDVEEKVVNALALQLTGVIRDNPKLLAWSLKTLGPKP